MSSLSVSQLLSLPDTDLTVNGEVIVTVRDDSSPSEVSETVSDRVRRVQEGITKEEEQQRVLGLKYRNSPLGHKATQHKPPTVTTRPTSYKDALCRAPPSTGTSGTAYYSITPPNCNPTGSPKYAVVDSGATDTLVPMSYRGNDEQLVSNGIKVQCANKTHFASEATDILNTPTLPQEMRGCHKFADNDSASNMPGQKAKDDDGNDGPPPLLPRENNGNNSSDDDDDKDDDRHVPLLTPHAIRKAVRSCEEEPNFKPICQIINIKDVSPTWQNPSRFRIIVSDGECYIPGVLDPRLNPIIENNELIKNNVVRINRFHIQWVKSKNFMIVSGLDILDTTIDATIGSPMNVNLWEIVKKLVVKRRIEEKRKKEEQEKLHNKEPPLLSRNDIGNDSSSDDEDSDGPPPLLSRKITLTMEAEPKDPQEKCDQKSYEDVHATYLKERSAQKKSDEKYNEDKYTIDKKYLDDLHAVHLKELVGVTPKIGKKYHEDLLTIYSKKLDGAKQLREIKKSFMKRNKVLKKIDEKFFEHGHIAHLKQHDIHSDEEKQEGLLKFNTFIENCRKARSVEQWQEWVTEEQRLKNYNAACTIASIHFQALWRGILARKANARVICRVEEFRQFYKIWGYCVRLMLAPNSIKPQLPDWASLRDQQVFIRQHELVGEDLKTDERLTSSMEDAMKVIQEKTSSLDGDMEEIEGLPSLVRPLKKNDSAAVAAIKTIHLSGDVVKWLKTGDPKYVDFFVRRMKQLSSGERSRILAKRLNGSTTTKVPIYETYLEQKSGFRILWTENYDYLLVWYVAKHHRVSHLMRLIQDSKNRSDRQRISIHEAGINIDDSGNADASMDRNTTTRKDHHEIFLDPLGNVPLKVYDVGTEDIENITKQDWTPTLHLTKEEREIVETEGTVLLLGRSGTGKTICICNRMEYDRQQQQSLRDPFFSQLFIARSPRLCSYVKKNIGQKAGSEFITFERVLVELETVLPKVDGIRDSFPENLMMKFSTFQREVYGGEKGVDTLIVWTNIRSFLKGSIEALQNNSSTSEGNTKDFFVSHGEYLSETNFGKKRCRLNTYTREIIYEIFLSYKQKLAETKAWDECDRIVALIQRLISAKTSHPELFEGQESWCKWSKIYVDEVQDYTQLEILLFFHLGGAGNLFLAGDPAQNVTKGVEFRFDDIRSVGYHIAGDDRRLIPQKPKIITVNFRSHAGILNAAASILSQMFAYFPDSAKQLGRDDGLFKGPRPGMFHKVKSATLAELLSQNLNGTVVLTHDECVKRVIEKLGGYELVYGIRRAKGLEFKSVIIIDFFSLLPSESQKPWR